MTELEKEEALIDRSNIEPYHPIVLKELAQKFLPKGYRFIPRFCYKYLNRILHIDEFNEFFESAHYGTGQQFLDGVCSHLNLKYNMIGPGVEELKNLTDKPVMFASNHPYGGPEGILVFSYLHKIFPRARILVQSFLKFIRPFSEVCVYNKKEIETLNKAVEDKRPLFFYPAGYCSRELSNRIVFDYVWKSTFVKFAKQNNMPVTVIYTQGQLSNRTLRWTKFRKFFHIKASIETVFLPDELFKLRDKTINMTFSHIIDPAVFDDSVSAKEWAARLRQYCLELKDNPNAVFDPTKPATLTLI